MRDDPSHAAAGGAEPRPATVYGLTVLAVLAAGAVRGAFDAPLGDQLPFVAFVVSTTFASWLGGWRPALLATTLGFLLPLYFFVPPRHSFYLAPGPPLLGAAVYFFVCFVVTGFGESMRAARRRADARSALLEATLAGLGDAVIALDAAERITFVNAAAAHLLGTTPEAALGRPLQDAFRPVEETGVRTLASLCADAARFGRVVVLPESYTLRDAAGVERPIDGTVAPVHGAPDAAGWVIVFRDVGERRRSELELRSSEERFRLLAAAANDGLWDVDLAARRIWWNDAYDRLYGPRSIETDSSTAWWEDRLHPDDRERVAGSFAAALSGDATRWIAEYRFRRADGTYAFVMDRGLISRDARGAAVRAAGSMLDLTELKNAVEALREADRRKDEFLATLAHELRNPLAPIRTAVQIMNLQGSGDRRDREIREMIDRQVGHMVRLVDDLLDVSRITRGRVELKRSRVRLADVVRTAVETSAPQIEAGRHRLNVATPSEPIEVEGDTVRLTQVVANLLNNAAKYTPEAGEITLSVERRDDSAFIRVRDTGLGIPPEMLGRVFEMFTQVNRHLGRSQGGLGIGLMLVKRLVELHGGAITARSDGEGLGAEFEVRLPLASSLDDPTPAPAAHAAAATVARRVVVIDDNADAANSLARLLALRGHEVRTAYDGASGIELVRSFGPEVVLLDLGMPKMDGYEAARRMRSLETGRELVLVALTGWGQEQDRRRTHEAGFNFHLVKPADPATLHGLLASLPAR